MVQARIPFGQYDPMRDQYNLGFNNTYPTWGSYDQWRARVPQYEAFRQSSRIPLKSSTDIFTDIVLPKLAAAAITHGAKIGRSGGGKLGKAPNPNRTDIGEAEVVENFVKSIIKEMGLKEKKYGASPIPSNSEVFRIAELEHNKRVAAAREAELDRLEKERKKKELEEQKKTAFKPRAYAPVMDTDINRRPGLAPLDKPKQPTGGRGGAGSGERDIPPPPPPKQPTGGRGGASSGERDIPPEYQPPPLPRPPSWRPGGEGHYDIPDPEPVPSGTKPQHDKATTLSSWDKRVKTNKQKAMNTLLWRRRRGGG